MIIANTDIQGTQVIADSTYSVIKDTIELKPTSFDIFNVCSFILNIPVASTITDFTATIVSEDESSWGIIYRSTITGLAEFYDQLLFANVVLRNSTNYNALPWGVYFKPSEVDFEDEENEDSEATLYLTYTIELSKIPLSSNPRKTERYLIKNVESYY
jgi:hypothetical protein